MYLMISLAILGSIGAFIWAMVGVVFGVGCSVDCGFRAALAVMYVPIFVLLGSFGAFMESSLKDVSKKSDSD